MGNGQWAMGNGQWAMGKTNFYKPNIQINLLTYKPFNLINLSTPDLSGQPINSINLINHSTSKNQKSNLLSRQ
jgi:hypothetical protein